MPNQYCMFKGKLDAGAPYFPTYTGSPHYIITVTDDANASFNIVVNSASTAPTPAGDNRVYFYADLNFQDPVTEKLDSLPIGLQESGFPRLDYWQDRSLLDLHRMRPVPFKDENGSRVDVNDIIDEALTIDESKPFELRDYFGGRETAEKRKFWKPTSASDVIVYGFGFLFLPAKDGLHETHMNQGNPRAGGHARENGAFQDGAVIIQRDGAFSALFTAFQTQYVPTDSRGFPIQGAVSLPDYIARG